MNKLRGIKHCWIWKKDGILYKATLYNNAFTIRNANINNKIILRIRGLTLDSQNIIIKNMHRIKNKSECEI